MHRSRCRDGKCIWRPQLNSSNSPLGCRVSIADPSRPTARSQARAMQAKSKGASLSSEARPPALTHVWGAELCRHPPESPSMFACLAPKQASAAPR